MTCHGKVRRMGRSIGRTADWKKALVCLKAGDSIEFV
jgi:ribosomal protein L23